MYAAVEDLADVVLNDYLLKLETKSPGVRQRALEAVSLEVDDHLRGRFTVPLVPVPPIIKKIVCTLSAYRVVGGVPGLLDETTYSYLKDQVRACRVELQQISSGELVLYETAPSTEYRGEIRVQTPKRVYNADLWAKY